MTKCWGTKKDAVDSGRAGKSSEKMRYNGWMSRVCQHVRGF